MYLPECVWCRLQALFQITVERIDTFIVLKPDEKAKLKGALLNRFGQYYTPPMSLAVLLDPRRRFSFGPGVKDFGSRKGAINHQDAENKLKKMVQTESAERQRLILNQFHELLRGEHYDFDNDADDDALLRAADDVPLTQWWAAYQKAGVNTDLATLVCVPVFSMQASAADVERLNSVRAGIESFRANLSNETSRALATCTFNRAAIRRFRARVPPARGHFALGRGLLGTEKRSARALAMLTLTDEEETADLTGEALVLRLREMERNRFVAEEGPPALRRSPRLNRNAAGGSSGGGSDEGEGSGGASQPRKKLKQLTLG